MTVSNDHKKDILGKFEQKLTPYICVKCMTNNT